LGHPYFFGYGSLVNLATHDYRPFAPATLTGWRRKWCQTGLRALPYLSVYPVEKQCIDGLVACVPDANWAALDERETGYDRAQADIFSEHAVGDVQLYHVPDRNLAAGGFQSGILLSYLDCVVQGYIQNFGLKGAEAFFDTTDGWDAPITDDRVAPLYPRSVQLDAAEILFVDHMLSVVT
jgi:hypothetical protein